MKTAVSRFWSRGTSLLAPAFLPLVVYACSSSGEGEYTPPPIDLPDGAKDGAPTDTGTAPDVTTTPDTGTSIDAGPVACNVSFSYKPPAGKVVGSVAVAGEWQSFARPGVPLVGPDANGTYTAAVTLPPGTTGLVGYKLIIDGNYDFDPAQPLRKFVGGVENSAIELGNCAAGSLTLVQKTATRPSANTGTFGATVKFTGSRPLDPASVKVTLKKDATSVTSPTATVNAGAQTLTFQTSGLSDGKYTALVEAKGTDGTPAEPLRLVFWVEPETFDWRDAIIYMTMTDRFANGDPSNDQAPPANVDSRTVYKGGDLTGVKNAIASGYLDQIGVRAIWLSPFNTNPAGAFAASDGVHSATGYHGYWPVKAREVDPRLGGAAALKAVIKEAHAHGIRILMDFVVNHVHEDHEYFKAHPDWFRTGCVCGTNNCDWTDKRLECLFTPYLPDVNWTVPEVSKQFADDAVWWVDEFDLDGFRLDAVKHVEDLAVRNLSARLRKTFEPAGTRLFLTGETAMGWNDCGNCNKSQYDTISHYIGPFGLDGQMDFVLYHAVPYRSFAYGDTGFIHADYWESQSNLQYPAGSIMTPFIGSQDSSRFSSLATYRNNGGNFDRGIAGNQWSNIAGPSNADALGRERVALAWVLSLPGAPLLYYGDEYGEFGGADPNNRALWRGQGTLNADEQKNLAFTKLVGSARRELPALRRGDYRSVYATEDQLVFARQILGGPSALVALNRSTSPSATTATLPNSLGIANGTVLRDRLGGPSVTVQNGRITLTIPAQGAAILAP